MEACGPTVCLSYHSRLQGLAKVGAGLGELPRCAVGTLGSPLWKVRGTNFPHHLPHSPPPRPGRVLSAAPPYPLGSFHGFSLSLGFSRFCVGDKFFLKNNMILCQMDYEEGQLNGTFESQVQ